MGLLALEADAGAGNASVTFKKELSGLFTITIRDSDGIKEFSLVPVGKLPYGGSIGGCPTTRKIDNSVFDESSDFTPVMTGFVEDCAGNRDELELPPPKNGFTSSKRVGGTEITPPPVKPSPTPSPTPSGAPASAPTPTVASEASPAAAAGITYPVAELGNCQSEKVCRSYCDRPENLEACLVFAEKHKLVADEELARGKKFAGVLKSGGGPGGCKTPKSCETYCNDVDRLDECVAFGEQNGFLKGRELDEAKKVQSLVKQGKKLPGSCKNKTACDSYCKNPEHMEECLAFAEESGFLSGEELAQAKKFLPLMKKGETPGGCKGKDECESYCQDEKNLDECIAFADKHDLIPPAERELIRKTGGKGPGGCRGKIQCEAFCGNPANQKACFEFGKEHGLIKEEDLRRMEEGRNQIKKVFSEAPPEVQSCLEQAIPGGLSAVESGEFFGGPELGEKMRTCFEQAFGGFGPPVGGGGHGGPGGDFSGPGDCKSQEECQAFCQENPEECQDFHPPAGGPPGGGFSGPGGCKGIDECFAYCKEHPEECQGFGPPGGPSGGGPGGPPEDFPGKPGEFPGRSGSPAGGPPSDFPPAGRFQQNQGRDGLEDYSGSTYSSDFDLKCNVGWNVEVNSGKKYCAITQEKCSELHPGTVLTKDRFGFNVCWPKDNREPRFKERQGEFPGREFGPPRLEEHFSPPAGLPGGSSGGEEFQRQFQEEYQRQFQEQSQKEFKNQFRQQQQQEIFRRTQENPVDKLRELQSFPLTPSPTEDRGLPGVSPASPEGLSPPALTPLPSFTPPTEPPPQHFEAPSPPPEKPHSLLPRKNLLSRLLDFLLK